MSDTATSGRIHTALAAAAVGPLLVPMAAALWVIVGWMAGADPFWRTPELNVAEAASVRDHAEVVRLIETGQDPNRTWPVRPGLIDGEGHEMTPLDAAVAIGRLDLVKLLVRHGAAITAENRPALVARAEARDARDITAYLTQPLP
ncbi:MAG: hypothetical protein ACRD26_05750 [Vicinamibacterales bacterium]